MNIIVADGRWGGIRTHGTLSRTPVFKTGSLNHSDTHPSVVRLYSVLEMAVNPAKQTKPLIFGSADDHCPGVVAGGRSEPSPDGIDGTCCAVSNKVRLNTIATSTSKSATKKIPDLSMRLLMSRYVKAEYVQFEAARRINRSLSSCLTD